MSSVMQTIEFQANIDKNGVLSIYRKNIERLMANRRGL
uniref:Uncharacterized protein n=1 Tax=Candidatus Kentrum sp. FW TaxID=2126338 RepID=A0A450SSC0_9GAMM|nr:MAG: hypothetical protein BECKFW1821A_GA0114235_106410 [Candidatus Kentron sp. FW]